MLKKSTKFFLMSSLTLIVCSINNAEAHSKLMLNNGGARQDATNIAAWASSNTCNNGSWVGTPHNKEEMCNRIDEQQKNAPAFFNHPGEPTQRKYKWQESTYHIQYADGRGGCIHSGFLINGIKTPIESCDKYIFCEKKKYIERDVELNNGEIKEVACSGGGVRKYRNTKKITYNGVIREPDLTEYFYTQAECDLWGKKESQELVANNCVYKKPSDSWDWRYASRKKDIDAQGRLLKYSMSFNVSSAQYYNFRREAILDDPTQGESLIGTYYPRMFADRTKIKKFVIKNVSGPNIPIGIKLVKHLEDNVHYDIYQFPNDLGNQGDLRISRFPSEKDFVFQTNLQRNCGVLEMNNLENIDFFTGAVTKPLRCSRTGTEYLFEDIDWNNRVTSVDLTQELREGYIPYVYYIVKGGQRIQGNRISLDFEAEYY